MGNEHQRLIIIERGRIWLPTEAEAARPSEHNTLLSSPDHHRYVQAGPNPYQIGDYPYFLDFQKK